MKKFTLIAITLVFLGSMSFAQKSVKQINAVKNSNLHPIQKVLATVCDTLLPPTASLPCGDSLTYYGMGTDGYVTGNDSYGDLEDAQKYYNTTSGNITGVIAGLVAIKAATGTANVYAKVYGVNATTKGPSTLLGTSDAVAMSAISTTGGFQAFTFSTPVAVTGNFFISIALPTTTGDTLVVFSTHENCNGGDSLSWEMFSDNSWNAFPSTNNFGPSFNPDLVIYPILCHASSGIVENFANGIKLEQNQPNPATANTLIQYEIQNNSNVSLKVYDITGREVISTNEGNQVAGNHSIVINAGNLQAGSYFYTLTVGNYSLTKKMIVTK